ncbi:MAG: endonuclease/exonuclease/phosphatase family protein [Cyclobacteriaceae bacterium]
MRVVIISIFFISLLLFSSVYLSPEYLDYTGLLPLLIPLFILLNLFLVVLLLFGKTRLILYPLLALAIGWRFLVITFQWNDQEPDKEGLSLMSFNTMLFNHHWDQGEIAKNAIQWANENPADIKCFQEFYQDFTTPSRNALKILSDNGRYEYAFQAVDGNPKKKFYGIAIFSKYPIINEGKVFDNRKNNGAMFADIKIDKDTIRVYNTHLESMSIVTKELNNLEGIRSQYRQTIRKLKEGIQMRARQTRILKEHMEKSPYPVLLVGDFNDLPYSHTYFSLRGSFNNAFEEAGRGFGFTYNKVLFFLRIDNIFFDDFFQVHHFKTHREVDYSDHYPISAIFTYPGSQSINGPVLDQ